MRRAALLLACVCTAACTQAPGNGGSRLTFPQAPVILISVDTLRADHLPAYGYRAVETPAVDALRRDAILYENAYSHVPLTLPSHVSMLTGLLPQAHGVRDNLGYDFDAKGHPTLQALLKDHGYATGAAVSAYVLRARTGLGAGFDFYEDAIAMPQEVDVASQVRRPGGDTTRALLRWLETVKGRPFFVLLHLYEPHSPYEPPEPFKTRYPLAYDGAIAAADAIVGDFLQSLKRLGLYDPAVVLFVSDHGEGLGDHGEDFHGILLYREALHVPLLLKLPGARRGGTSVRTPVALTDLVPTMADVLDLPAPQGLPGLSLLDPARLANTRGIYGETYYPRIHLGWSDLRSLLDERYHLIDGPDPELYDMRDDPGEKTNLLARERPRAEAMKRALAGLGRDFAAPQPVDGADLEKLHALGYLGGATVTETASTLPDPKQSIHVLADVKTAFRLTASGNDEQAVRAFRSLLVDNPRLFDVQYELGRALARLGRYGEAAEVFKIALANAPSFAGPVGLALARVEIELGHLDSAAADARLAMAMNPAQVHEILARVALARDDLAATEREAAQAKGDTLAELNAAVIQAEVRIRRAQLSEALAVLETTRRRIAAEGLPALRDLAFLRGDALARLGKHAEAEAAFREEIRSFPRNAQAWARLAIVLALEGHGVPEVRALLDSMVAASPSRETALLAAQTLDSMGDREGGALWRRRTPEIQRGQR